MLQLPLYLSGCDFKSEKDYCRGGGATSASVTAERKLVILDMVCLYLTSLVANHALAQAVSHWPSTRQAQFRSKASSVGFVVDKVMLGQVFL